LTHKSAINAEQKTDIPFMMSLLSAKEKNILFDQQRMPSMAMMSNPMKTSTLQNTILMIQQKCSIL
jgi:hypothetical protein